MKKSRKRPILFLFLLAVVILYVIIYIVPRVTGAFVSSYTATYGELKLYDAAEAWLIRGETVYTAGSSGKANRYIEDGTLVRRGTAVMEVNGSVNEETDGTYTDLLSRLKDAAVETDSFVAEEGGIICYAADGYENILTPEKLKRGDYAYFSQISQKAVQELERDTILAGEPVFKVVDRTRWYLVCYLSADSADRYAVGETVSVEFSDDTVDAEILYLHREGSRLRIVLQCGYYYAGFARTRAAKVNLVTFEDRGLLVENESIDEQDGAEGVYVKNRAGDFVFVPIEARQTDGAYTLVTDTMFVNEAGEQVSTVEPYDEILKRPPSA